MCLCEVCKWFLESGRKFSTTKKLRDTFTVSGFNDWKHALEKSRGFQQHEASYAHIEAVRAKAIFVGNIQGLDLQLNATKGLQRVHGIIAIKCVVDAILTLSRQNIAFRGHDANEGNLKQILGMVARNENCFLRELLRRSQTWTSADYVNEILQLLHNDILRRVLKDVRESFHGIFGVIIDEIQISKILNKRVIALDTSTVNLPRLKSLWDSWRHHPPVVSLCMVNFRKRFWH